MFHSFWRLILRQLLPAVLLAAVLLAGTTTAHALEKAVLQLKWLHHFQFAGYYIALEKGFYREAGLDVTIREGGPNAEVERDVAAGRADFGTGTSALLLDLAKGADFVVVGQVFQHSPAIFLTPRKTGIKSIGNMAGKRFMYANQHGDMLALLKQYHLNEDRIVKVPHQGDPRDLIEGKADVMLAYSFNEPYIMELAGEPYFTFSPLSSGIDFYGDNFFTTMKMVNERPDYVNAFRRASLRGWNYALQHKEETIKIILAKYSRGLSREHLLFEAEQMDMLIQPLMVELGYQSKTRWQHISDIFVGLGMLPKGFDPSPIVYAPRQPTDYRPLLVTGLVAIAIIGCLVWLVISFRSLNLRLKLQIEERQLAEEELRKSQELFSLLMKHTPVYTFIKEVDGEQSRVVLLSDNFIDMIGRPATELRGRTMVELFPEELARKMNQDDLTVIRSGEVVEVEEEFAGRSYTTIKFPILRESNSALIAGFTIDVTARKHSEALLQESNERFRLAFENANVGMCLVDLDGKFFKVNRQMAEILGYSREEFEQMTVNDIAHPDYRQVSTTFIKQAEEGKSDHAEFEKQYIHKDGHLVCGLVSSSLVRNAAGEPCYFISHLLDVTKQKEAEETRLNLERQLFHAQKLESLGILAGGIAHDFNNLLTAIVGNADLALMKLSPDSPAVSCVQQIEKAAERATDLAKQMLAYSGKGRFLIEKLDLNHLLKDMLHILEVSISKKNELRLNLPSSLPNVEADATQLRQIIMNLVINASEAIGDNQGVIAITTGCQLCDRICLEDFWLHENLEQGPYLFLEVTDTGCGMDSETISKIFDPFFTTKFTGRGLGMSAVMGIVRGHKGAIKVESEPDRGTTFKVLLPACDTAVSTPARETQHDDWRGKGTVLLVDDEEQVREIGTIMLEQLGLNVITAGNGQEALEKFTANDNISVVILDLTMPKMDGEQCFRELRKLDTNVKIIMSSGYSVQEITRRLNESELGFIQKPYKLSNLQSVLKGLV